MSTRIDQSNHHSEDTPPLPVHKHARQQRDSAASAPASEADARDETGNRALHASASGPNANLGRADHDDTNPATRQSDDGGSIESA